MKKYVLLLLAILCFIPSPALSPAADPRKPARPQARIRFFYESVFRRSYRTFSLGQLYHYGTDTVIHRIQGEMRIEVKDADLFTPVEIRDGNKILASQPRHTTWGIVHPGEEKLKDGSVDLSVSMGIDEAVLKKCTGSYDFTRDAEFNDYGFAPHSKTQLQWHKETRTANRSNPLPTICPGIIWSLQFTNEGLRFFTFRPPAELTKETWAGNYEDYRNSTHDILPHTSMSIPHPGEEGEWKISRSVSRNNMHVTGERRKDNNHEDGQNFDRDRTTERMVFTLDLEPAAYALIITPPKNYKAWVPRGGKSEDQPGRTLAFSGEFRCTEGTPDPGREFELRAYLDSSTQPGVCMNYPQAVASPALPDLKILRDGTSPEIKLEQDNGKGSDDASSTAIGKFKLNRKFTVNVGCYDYGAFGSLLFASDVPVRIEGFDDRSSLALPFDENRNKIADAAETDAATIGYGGVDNDGLPRTNIVEGDGLTAYEEYRGFVCRGVHTRTDPMLKDLFLFDPTSLGAGIFPTTGVTLHFIAEDEFLLETGAPNTHVINFNRGHATLGPQHLLELRRKSYGGSVTGKADGSKIGSPRETPLVNIDAAKLKLFGEPIGPVIAHELGHGCGAMHHGIGDYEPFDMQLEETPGKFAPYVSPDIPWRVAVNGGPNSGDENCVMRYSDASHYEFGNGRFRWRKTPKGPYIRGELIPLEDVPQTRFCQSKKGTGINDAGRAPSPVAGDARNGNCLHWLQVNDSKPRGRPE